jgi:hypothetical protein
MLQIRQSLDSSSSIILFQTLGKILKTLQDDLYYILLAAQNLGLKEGYVDVKRFSVSELSILMSPKVRDIIILRASSEVNIRNKFYHSFIAASHDGGPCIALMQPCRPPSSSQAREPN